MIVNDGKLYLLELQVPDLETCFFGLFTNNFTITLSTSLSDLTEAAWSGYVQVLIGTLVGPTLSSDRAVVTPVTPIAFTNTSGSPVNFYGWFMVDAAQTRLIAAVNVGVTTIPDGMVFNLNARVSNTNE